MNKNERIHEKRKSQDRFAFISQWALGLAITGFWGLIPFEAPMAQVPARPEPLTLLQRHSADVEGDVFNIDTNEAAIVLDLWRSGSYGINLAAYSGYEAAGGTNTGVRHTADHEDPPWEINYREMAGFMALHRADAYAFDGNAASDFAPVNTAWTYNQPSPLTITGTVRYVSANATNPVAPYVSLETAAATIQDALDNAGPGDMVLVDRGVYSAGAISNAYGFSRVDVTQHVVLASIHGPDETIIEGAASPATRGVLMNHGQAEIHGFTIREGRTTGPANSTVANGAGLLALAAGNLSYLKVHSSSALTFGVGGGIHLDSVQGMLQKSLIYSNTAYFGGGLSVYNGSQTTITQLESYRNRATGSGGGVLLDNIDKAYNLLIRENQAMGNGGGLYAANNATTWFVTLLDNAATNQGPEVWFNGTGNAIRNAIVGASGSNLLGAAQAGNTLRYSLTPETVGPNISEVNNQYGTPVFLNEVAHDYHLDASSPGIGAGESAPNAIARLDLDDVLRKSGSGVDLGAYAAQRLLITNTETFYIPGQPVEVPLQTAFSTEAKPLTQGLAINPPAGWSFTNLTSTNALLELSPDNGGYVITGDLNRSNDFVVSLVADAASTNDVTFDVSALWMVNGMTDLAESTYQAVVRPSYFVTAIANTGGSVSITGAWYAADSLAEITALPDEGYRFLRWTGDTNNATYFGDTILVPVASTLDLTAEFIELIPWVVNSSYGFILPGTGTLTNDIGSVVTSTVQTAAVEVDGTNLVCVGFYGTGDAPASGSERSVSFTLNQASSVTWQWVELNGQQESRGYRAAGNMIATITCTVDYETNSLINQVWWQTELPAGSTITAVRGDQNPALDGDYILIDEGLDTGRLEFEYDVILPPDSFGSLVIGGSAGVNQPE